MRFADPTCMLSPVLIENWQVIQENVQIHELATDKWGKVSEVRIKNIRSHFHSKTHT